jgi:hypothetical protein
MQTDVFYWHGFTEIWLDGAWRKATPAFNLSLCERFGLHPLEFDGIADSIYHPFDRSGRRHMEYLALRGSYDDVPLDEILADFRAHYPRWMDRLNRSGGLPGRRGPRDRHRALSAGASRPRARPPPAGRPHAEAPHAAKLAMFYTLDMRGHPTIPGS